MRKAEVETVKAYARRQSDRARPAYGHFLEDRPRRSIDFGTTNDDEYMLSQTGNRCFWGMKMVRPIDLEKLRADRLQIWGEAAHYQSQGEALTIDPALWPDARPNRRPGGSGIPGRMCWPIWHRYRRKRRAA